MESAESQNLNFNNTSTKQERTRSLGSKKKISLVVMLVGIAVLIIGAVIMVKNLTVKPIINDADFLVEIGAWKREDAPSVEWLFLGIGSGSLTTDGHLNDYPFIWAIEDNVIKIESDWLYSLNNQYTYSLDQPAKKLILQNENEEVVLIPGEKPAGEAKIEEVPAPTEEPAIEQPADTQEDPAEQ